MKKHGISGYVCIRNGVSLDYCFAEAIQSLLPVCDEVVVCDSDSTDSTPEVLAAIALTDPKIRIINKPWDDPVGSVMWWIEWMNWVRVQLDYDHQLQLDGDEVLGPESFDGIKSALQSGSCLFFKRLNFWGSAQTIAQSGDGGVGIGDGVARFGPSELYMRSDDPVGCEMKTLAGQAFRPDLRIFHYGLLRSREAMIAKTRICLRAWFDRTDERMEKMDREGLNMTDVYKLSKPLIPFNEPHPAVIQPWLLERGYTL